MINQIFKRIIFFVLVIFSQSVVAQNIPQWYNEAQQRIDTLRKGPFKLEIYNQDGSPYTGLVKVRMVKHEFPFGMSFDFYEGEIKTDVPTQTQWMKAAMYKYFNYGVTGNSFKWSGVQPYNTTPNYTNFENALNWAQKVGWEMRGHTLLWGGTSYEDDHPTPRWVKDLPTTEDKLAACEERVKRDIGRYKGIVKEYDVINEPVHANYLQSVVGDSLNWKCFQWAYEADPDARLFINDYNVEYIWGDADEYKSLIENIIAEGGPVSGIGMQAHFWDCCRPDITNFVTQINKLATIGLPIRLTEYDYGGNLTEAEQAEDFIKVATIAFSHPSVDGMISWGLFDGFAWRENTGYFDAEHRPKLAADTLLYLTKKRWATNFETTATGSSVDFDAYYGDYVVEVSFEGSKKQFSVPCVKANKNTTFKLYANDAEPKSPELVMAQLSHLDELELIFDEAIAPASVDKYDFRVFASNGISISNISVKNDADSVLVLSLSKEVLHTDYATVSYFPGSLLSTEGGVASAFGTEKIVLPAGLNEAPVVNNQSFDLQENLSGSVVAGTVLASDPEGSALSFTITDGNSAGVFRIDVSTGKIYVNTPSAIDYDTNPVYNLSVEVSDGVNTVNANITINILKITGINDQMLSDVQVYPVPAEDVITITSGDQFKNIVIYDLGGKVLLSKKYELPVSEDIIRLNLQRGVYILKVDNGYNVHTSKVLIK